MADLDVAKRAASGANAFQEIGPQLANVLVVGLVQRGRLMDRGLLLVAGIKVPAVQPAHVEGSFGAVEIAADIRLFRFVAGVLAMLPDRGERFELEGGYLSVGRISGIALDVA